MAYHIEDKPEGEGAENRTFGIKEALLEIEQNGFSDRLLDEMIALYREICPENYKAIPGWYIEGCKSTGKPIQLDEIPPELLKYLPAYYTELLEHESDVMTTEDISRFTGYSKCAVNGWVKRGHLRAFQRGASNLVPKVFLVEFFCSKAFRTTQRRNAWHIHAVQYFPLWVQCKTLKNAEQATE